VPNEHWRYQGRQYHTWFGHGTAPKDGEDGASFDDQSPAALKALLNPANVAQRVEWIGHSLVGHVARRDRAAIERSLSGAGMDRLKDVVAVAYGARGLSRDAFRQSLLDPSTSDEVVDSIRAAAAGAVEARTTAALNAAGEALASAVQGVGSGSWSRFLADADRRAVTAVSGGAVPGIVQASAAGTDLPNSILLGGLAVMTWLLLGQRQPGSQAPAPRPVLPNVMPMKPPRDAKDRNGAKAPGKPGEAEKFKDPKGGEQWVNEPDGTRHGWLDADGNVWVPTGPPGPGNHGGPHWDVEYPNGRYRNVRPIKEGSNE
jgi:hypothetical protein